ncbi:MAG TPA: hypothetical protein VHU82_10025 [Vicinamibacterales bacterium]|nr:hypothetical protein [Vicinamibacterales bacterium]
MSYGDSSVSGAPRSNPRRRRLAFLCLALTVALIAAYSARCVLLLDVARFILDRDAALVAQEKTDGVAVVFGARPSAWIAPMKNLMNPIWQPIGATGVNYYTFAGPARLLSSYSERSNPLSPYYQAWVGGYVTKRQDGTLPTDLPAWAKQVTELDQRSWLTAMGDRHPLADFSAPTTVQEVVIDGHALPLWHGTMRSHSDLSDDPEGALATLVGMPPKASWPAGARSFHDLTLDGYFVCWSDSTRNVSVVIYAVDAIPAAQSARERETGLQGELLSMMRAVKFDPVR